MKRTQLSLAMAILTLAAAPAHAAELLANGDFETQTFVPWDPQGAQPWFTGTGVTGDLVKFWNAPGTSGRSAHFGGPAGALGLNTYIAQSFDLTGVKNALLTFDLTTVAHGAPGTAYLDVSINAQDLVDDRFGSLTDGEVHTVHVSVLATGLSGSGSASLAFFGGTGSDTGTDIYIDNVSLKPQAVPEPAGLAAMGLGAFALARRRRQA